MFSVNRICKFEVVAKVKMKTFLAISLDISFTQVIAKKNNGNVLNA